MSLADRRPIRVVASLSLALSLCAMCAPSPARAVPATPEISQRQSEVASAQSELERMRAQLEVKVEEYNAMTEAVEQTEIDIDAARQELTRAVAELRSAQGILSERVSGMYRHGGIDAVDMFLGAGSFEDLFSRLDLLRRISASDASTVERVREARDLVEETERSLELRHSEQVVLQRQAKMRAAAIEDEVARQQGYVARLDADVRRLIAEEDERQQTLAAERARQAAAAAAAAAAKQPSQPTPGPPPAGTGGAQQPPPPGSASGAAPSGGVVGIALQYIGVPYAWGGSSPSGFDCSGLVQYVYRQVGVSLPRTSQTQFRAGQHIPADRVDLLQAGDLVFFGTNGDPSRVHHVGIYVGAGNYIHAPSTGAFVRVNSLTGRIQSSRDYVGGSRI